MRNISLKLVIAFLFLGGIATAQSAEKRTILVNGEATEVMVTPDGVIESTIKARPAYMNGYVKAPANLARPVVDNPVLAEIATSTSTGTEDTKISFDSGKFVLDNSGTTTLTKVIGNLDSAEKGFILLRSKFEASSTASNMIAQKRVYACKKYLESKGVAPNKILISLEPGNADSGDVNVFIR